MSDPDHSSGAVLEDEATVTVTDEAIETRWLVEGGRTTAHSDDAGDDSGDDAGDDAGDDTGDDAGDDTGDAGDDAGDDSGDTGDDSGGADA